MRITSGGNVGIGTTSIFSKLQVRAGTDQNIGFEGPVQVGTGATLNVYNDAHSANVPLEIRANPTVLGLVGNVGIGKTSPGQKLDVAGNINSSGTMTAASFSGSDAGLTNVTATTAAVATNALALGGVAASGYATLGANTFTADQTRSSGNLNLPSISGSTAGVITLGGNPFLHAYGVNNTFVGTNAGNFSTTGIGNNTAIGYRALSSNTTGVSNSAIGNQALQYNTTGGQHRYGPTGAEGKHLRHL